MVSLHPSNRCRLSGGRNWVNVGKISEGLSDTVQGRVIRYSWNSVIPGSSETGPLLAHW